MIARVRDDFPNLPILHVDDIARRKRVGAVPDDSPTIYKPFGIAALQDAVRKPSVRHWPKQFPEICHTPRTPPPFDSGPFELSI